MRVALLAPLWQLWLPSPSRWPADSRSTAAPDVARWRRRPDTLLAARVAVALGDPVSAVAAGSRTGVARARRTAALGRSWRSPLFGCALRLPRVARRRRRRVVCPAARPYSRSALRCTSASACGRQQRSVPAPTSRTTWSSRRACCAITISRSKTTTRAATTASTSAAICGPISCAAACNEVIYSIHAPGLPALLVPAFAIGGYRGAVVMLCLFGALAALAVFDLATLLAGPAAAWATWAAVCLTVPFVPHAWLIFPEMPGALLDGVGGAVAVRAAACAHRAPGSGAAPRSAIAAVAAHEVRDPARGDGRARWCCGCGAIAEALAGPGRAGDRARSALWI